MRLKTFFQYSNIPSASMVCLLSTTVLALSFSVEAQQTSKIYHIGFLSGGFPGPSHWTTKLQKELRNLGYVEGKNLIIDSRYTENKIGRLSALANELVHLKVDVIVAGGRNDTRAAKNATRTIPIIGLSLNDPIKDGLVQSLAHPGGNVTGMSILNSEVSGKRLEILKEIVPKLSRVAILWNPQFPEAAGQWNESQKVARELHLQPHSMEVRTASNLDEAFKAAIEARSNAVFITTGVFNNTYEKRIAELAIKYRLPTIYDRERFVDNGGLLSYGPDESERYRRVAVLVDKILKGVKPADLPVEQPTKFELVINLKTAKQIRLIIPPNVLARADKVIK
jgi:putative ABC transport system substrate-binding protein